MKVGAAMTAVVAAMIGAGGVAAAAIRAPMQHRPWMAAMPRKMQIRQVMIKSPKTALAKAKWQKLSPKPLRQTIWQAQARIHRGR